MKRSEMVKVIAIRIQDIWFGANQDCDYREGDHLDIEKASRLLAVIESGGMLPPRRYTNEGEEPSDPRWHGLNGWEPENE